MGLVQFGSNTFDADLIAFDKDGTLFDFGTSLRAPFLAGVERLAANYAGRSSVRAELYRTLGYNSATGKFDARGPFATSTNVAIGYALVTVLFQHSSPEQDWSACEQLVGEEFGPLFEGSRHLKATTSLEALFSSLHSSGVKVAVISNDDARHTESALACFDIAPYVDFVAGGDGPYRHKPAPDALLAAAERLNVAPSRIAVVGDAVTDLEMGRAAGAGLRVGVLTGASSCEELAQSADLVLTSIDEIRVDARPAGQPEPAPDRSSDRPDGL